MEDRTSLVLLATEMMGAEASLAWLDTPHEELGGMKPSDIWNTPDGIRKIKRLLAKRKAIRGQ